MIVMVVGALAAGPVTARAATVSWAIVSDCSWEDGASRSAGLPPQSGDDVVIDRATGSFTISLSTASASIAGLECAEQIVVDGGALAVAGDVVVNGSIQLGSNSSGVLSSLTGGPGNAVTGSGEITFDAGDGIGGRSISIGSGHTLTIRAGITVRGESVSMGGTSIYGSFVNQGESRIRRAMGKARCRSGEHEEA